jgi:hypothetical protein
MGCQEEKRIRLPVLIPGSGPGLSGLLKAKYWGNLAEYFIDPLK